MAERVPRKKKSASKPSRKGLVQIGGLYQPPEVVRQLRIMAAEENKTMGTLLAEALNLLFAQYKRPEIAVVSTTTDSRG